MTTVPLKIAGGFSDLQPATERIQNYCNEVKKQVEAKTNQKYVEFKAVTYRSQIVAGMNYIIEIQVNECHYIHVKLHQELPCNGGKIVLINVQENHKKDDPLVPF
ncbi:cystatin-A-like [Betta splendens]|uniref:Cystatin-B n=1 Tax=Betta splendens TaxID=158456 RepID=A0A6P7M8E0_BETSP|nr:cystatin-A-like [Betta splendens]